MKKRFDTSHASSTRIRGRLLRVFVTLLVFIWPSADVLAQSVAPEQTTVVRSLQMPFNPDDAQDSDFLRQLLLSHGLMLDIGNRQSIGSTEYQKLIRSISTGRALSNPALSDVRDKFGLSLLKGSYETGELDSSPTKHQETEHRLVWWKDPTYLAPDPILSSANPAVVETPQRNANVGISLTRQPEPEPEPAQDVRKQLIADQTSKDDAISPAQALLALPTPFSPPSDNHEQDKSAPDANAGKVKPLFTVGNGVPAGFEALSGPQFMFVDVFYNEQAIGSTGITITDDSVLFDEPAEIALLLADSVADPELVNWLSKPLPTNGHLACYGNNDPTGCGQINADPLAVIYNAVLLRLDVFIKPEKQRVDFQQQRRYLATPADKGTAIFSLHGVASELSSLPSRVDLSGGAILSYGRGNVSGDIRYNDETNDTTLSTLKLTHHLKDYDLEVGTFGFSTGGALNDLDLIGIGFSTSFKTRVDLEQAFSSQLNIYLPRRSVVQLLINDRIYSGASYTAGNQALDTTALPDGTHEIEIVINDPVEGQRRERRLFTKSALIPPEGEWNLSANLGTLRDSTRQTPFPVASDLFTSAFSAARRVGDRSSIKVGFLQYDQTSIAQTDFLYLGEHLTFNFALSIGENNLRAASMQSSLRFNNQNLGLSATHFSSSLTPGEDSVESGFFVSDNTRVDLSYHHALPWLSFGARVGMRRENHLTNVQSEETRDIKTFSVFAQRPVLRGRNRRGILGFRYQKEDDSSNAQLSLNLYFGRGSWRADTGLTLLSLSENTDQWQARAAAGWRSDTVQGGSLSAGVYAAEGNTSSTYGVNTELRHTWFRANASSDVFRYDGNQQTRNSIASFSAYAGIDHEGASLGGSDFAESGVIVDVSGEPAGESFDVLVNNARVATATIGSPQFIGLQPFRHYEVKLRPNTVMGNGIGKGSHTLTLFPGNVERISLQAQRQALLIAMIVDESGGVINNAMVKTSSNTLVIDDSGILQAEVHDKEQLTVRRADGSQCFIQVSLDSTTDVVVPNLPIVCKNQPY